MASNLPESGIPDVRDYLYVDSMRVRSLLAQIDDGLRDEKSATVSRSRRLSLGTRLTGYERAAELSEAETLSLADLHVSMLEEAAESLGLLTDVSDKFVREKDWLRGKVRRQLAPGMLLRVTGPTLLMDTASLQTTFRDMQGALGQDDDEFTQFIDLLGALYGNGVAVSIRPTNEESARAAFVGAIPKQHGFAPMVSDLLLSRVGPEPQTMTSLIQLARIPKEEPDGKSAMQRFEGVMERFESITTDEALDRELLDGLLMQMARMMEAMGLAAAPKWPAVSILPIAIYRQVLPMPSLDD